MLVSVEDNKGPADVLNKSYDFLSALFSDTWYIVYTGQTDVVQRLVSPDMFE